jgi:AcrR family transcriptional regulator
MDGARDLLSAGQYSELTVDALARHLHMSKSTLYKYYRDKDDLVITMVREACDQTRTDLEDASELFQAGDPVDALRSLLEVYDAHAQRLPASILLETKRVPRAARNRIVELRKALEGEIKAVAERGVAEGRLRSESVGLVRTALVASANAALRSGATDGIRATDLLPLFV